MKLKGLLIVFVFQIQILFAQNQAQNFTVTDYQDEEFTLYDVLDGGQYVLLDFIATWCGPCAEGVEQFSQVYHYFGCNQSDLVVMAISSDGDDYDAQVFHNLYDGDHPIISGIDGGGNHVHQSYNILSLPTYMLIDTSGFIVYEGNVMPTFESLQTLLLNNGIEANACPPIETTQSLDFHQGWNLFSKNVITENELMEELFGSVEGQVVIVKDVAGNVYWPFFNLNTIGHYNVNEGYLVKFESDVILNLTGVLIPPYFEYSLNDGWNIMPYYEDESINAVEFLNSISSQVIIVKDEIGNVYLPDYNFNNIGALHEGKAYYIKLSEDVNFQY